MTNLPAPTHNLSNDMELAKALASSDLLPPHYRGKPANVLVGIGYGHALGLAPLVALNAITVIQGKPTLSAQLQSDRKRVV